MNDGLKLKNKRINKVKPTQIVNYSTMDRVRVTNIQSKICPHYFIKLMSSHNNQFPVLFTVFPPSIFYLSSFYLYKAYIM